MIRHRKFHGPHKKLGSWIRTPYGSRELDCFDPDVVEELRLLVSKLEMKPTAHFPKGTLMEYSLEHPHYYKGIITIPTYNPFHIVSGWISDENVLKTMKEEGTFGIRWLSVALRRSHVIGRSEPDVPIRVSQKEREKEFQDALSCPTQHLGKLRESVLPYINGAVYKLIFDKLVEVRHGNYPSRLGFASNVMKWRTDFLRVVARAAPQI